MLNRFRHREKNTRENNTPQLPAHPPKHAVPIVNYWNHFDQSLYLLTAYVVLISVALFLSAMIGIPLSGGVVFIEIIFIGLMLIQFIPATPFRISRTDGLTLAIIAASGVVSTYLAPYFKNITWDGALFLLNANMLITDIPIIYAFYKPMTWSALLTIGLNLGLAQLIPILIIILTTISTYLFALTLTKDKRLAQVASVFTIFIPILLLWGLSFYAETFLLFLVTFGFANYFHAQNSGKKFYYGVAMILFALAFLTKFSMGVLFVIPLIDAIRERKWLIQMVPIAFILVPYLIYQYVRAHDPLYAFKLYSFAVEGATNNLFTNAYYVQQMDSLFSWVLLFLSVVGLILFLRNRLGKNIFVFVLVSSIITAYLLFWLRLKDIRYFIWLVPLVTTMAAYFIMEFSTWVEKRLHKKVGTGIQLVCVTLILALLAVNFTQTIYPQYKYTGTNPVEDAAAYINGLNSPRAPVVMSNSHVIMSWHLQRKVWGGVTIEEMPDYLTKNKIEYIINFERSGTPAEMKDTEKLLPFGTIVQRFTDGFETINVIKVTA